MTKSINKKVRILLIIAAVAAVMLAAAIMLALVVGVVVSAVVYYNIHNIYVFSQDIGLFRVPIEVKSVDIDDVGEYTLDALRADPRVIFDQSLMLVNTQYMLDDDFKADVLEYKDTTVFMNRPMLDSYAALSAAVKQKTGEKLYVSSDFRTAEEQEELYREDPNTATLPGASEHQTGLALDVYVAYYAGDGFIKSESGRFVNSRCWKYGFIIRYPSYGEEITGIRFEPWHIRYVGHPHSDIIYNNHITLEEYVGSLSLNVWYEANGYYICRQIMSERATLELPEQYESCIISPDNTGAYIITVKK